MSFQSYQEEVVPNKDTTTAAAATEKSSLTIGTDREESKSKSMSKSKLKRWKTTPGISAAIVVAIMLCVVVVSWPSSLHGIRGIGGGGGGGGGGDASLVTLQQTHDPMCPTAGSPSVSGGSTQTPGVVFYGLDFSTDSYKSNRIPDEPPNPPHTYLSESDQVWQACASACNTLHEMCRTFTVHILTNPNGEFFGFCYYHRHWLDNHGNQYVVNSVGDRNIVSGVCRPEDKWNGYK